MLVWEERASAQFLRTYQAPTKKKPKKKVKLVKGARNKQKLGETIFKGHRSYDLMLNLQLGVRAPTNFHRSVCTFECQVAYCHDHVV